MIVSLCLSLQVAHLPADPHHGPNHLPAGLSGPGQAVSLAAYHVSLVHSVKHIDLNKSKSCIFVYNPKRDLVLYLMCDLLIVRKKSGEGCMMRGVDR